MLTPSAAIALNDPRRDPRLVRHLDDRHLRLVGVEGDPADQHAFHLVLAPSRTHVPSVSLNDDRTCIATPFRRATSTDRDWSTFAPDAASSSISS